jgi:hypothetical protein
LPLGEHISERLASLTFKEHYTICGSSIISLSFGYRAHREQELTRLVYLAANGSATCLRRSTSFSMASRSTACSALLGVPLIVLRVARCLRGKKENECFVLCFAARNFGIFPPKTGTHKNKG